MEHRCLARSVYKGPSFHATRVAVIFGNFDYEPSQYGSHIPGYRGTDITLFASIFPTEFSCLRHLFLFRTGGIHKCLRCGAETRDWRFKEPFKYYYHGCGGIYSPMVGTILERSKVSLQLWFYLMLLFSNSAQSLNIGFIVRHLNVSVPTALRMARQIRLHMALIDTRNKIGARDQVVVVQLHKMRRVINPRKGAWNRCTVLTLSDGNKVRAIVLPYPDRYSLFRAIRLNACEDSILVTDCHDTLRVATHYNKLETVLEWNLLDAGEGRTAKQAIHGFLAGFHEALKDQYRGVFIRNLWLYLQEFQFRYNRRQNSKMRFWDLMCEWPSLQSDWYPNLERKCHVQNSRVP